MALEGMLIGHYRLQRLIGSGGMGEVYFAEDIRISRRVAVKVVRNEADPYPNAQTVQETVRLFEREMKAITALDHPNILPLFDFGEEISHGTTLTYMVMPFRTEGSLVDWLHSQYSGGILAPSEVVHIVSQAANALQHAHNRNIMHLDVKPSNFLIRSREDAPRRPDLLLADFGIAKFNSATATASQSIRGTPTYMAPEQWAGSPVAATDQYALAVMAYQLLTGKPPFQGNMQQMMYQHLQGQPQPPSNINPQIPPSVDAVLLRALAKKPEQRFPSIQAFASAFEQAWQNAPLWQSTHYGAYGPPPPPPVSVKQFPQAHYVPPPPPPVPSSESRSLFNSIGVPQLIVILGLLVVVVMGSLAFALLNHPSTSTGSSSQTTPTTPPTPRPTPPPAYPQLKSSYSGTSTYHANNQSEPMKLEVSSQDQQGNISGQALFRSDYSLSCSFTGQVTTDNHISLTCTYNSNFITTFNGTIYPDGHIEGLETRGSDNWSWNIS